MTINSASAVLLLHATQKMGGAKPIISNSGSLSTGVAHVLDYNGRQNEWSEKGGCDRSITNDDIELYARGNLTRELDYVARLGDFSDKGKDHMVDCTYWGQHGPLSREEIERDMLQCGGCYFRSVLTVDRQEAPALNLTTKEDFQRLMRTVWSESVLKWGVTDKTDDIHWFANFHTDQPNNLHVHITTYFSKGVFDENREGWLVSARSTREQKSIIYRDAYKPITSELNIEKDYIRAYLIAQVKTELNIKITASELDRLSLKEKSATTSFGEPKRTLSPYQQVILDKKVGNLKILYQQSYGRIANNYQLKGQARKIFDDLKAFNSQINDAWERYEAIVHVYADRNGLAVEDRFLNPLDIDEKNATRYALLERNKFISSQMDDLKNRIVTPMIKGIMPVEQAKNNAWEIIRETIPKSFVREPFELSDNKLGLDKEKCERCIHLAEEITRNNSSSERQNLISEYAKIVVESPRMEKCYSEELTEYQRNQIEGGLKGLEGKKAFQDSLSSYAKNSITYLANTNNFNPINTAICREASMLNQTHREDFVRAVLSSNGIDLGLTLDKNNEIKQAVEVVCSVRGNKAPQASQLIEQSKENIVKVIVQSPVVSQKINEMANRLSNTCSISKNSAKDLVTNKVALTVGSSVSYSLNKISAQTNEIQYQQTNTESLKQDQSFSSGIAQGFSLAATVALIINVAYKGLLRDSATQNIKRGNKREQGREEQYLTYGREEIRS